MEMKSYSALFLMTKRLEGNQMTQKLSHRNIEIAILLSIVERSKNYVFKCKMPPPTPQSLWGEASQLWNSRLRIKFVIGKVYRHSSFFFWGGGLG